MTLVAGVPVHAEPLSAYLVARIVADRPMVRGVGDGSSGLTVGREGAADGSAIVWPGACGHPLYLTARALPELERLARVAARDVLVAPHPDDAALREQAEQAGHALLDPVEHPVAVLSAIATSRRVVASWLPAVVVAESLGISVQLVDGRTDGSRELRDLLRETGRGQAPVARTLDEALAVDAAPRPRIDLDALADSFPWRLWGLADRGSDSPPPDTGAQTTDEDDSLTAHASAPTATSARAVSLVRRDAGVLLGLTVRVAEPDRTVEAIGVEADGRETVVVPGHVLPEDHRGHLDVDVVLPWADVPSTAVVRVHRDGGDESVPVDLAVDLDPQE